MGDNAAAKEAAKDRSANELPAAATFAPSREDVLSTLQFFFGDPVVPEKLKDYSEHHAMCAVPRARALGPVLTFAFACAGPTTSPVCARPLPPRAPAQHF